MKQCCTIWVTLYRNRKIEPFALLSMKHVFLISRPKYHHKVVAKFSFNMVYLDYFLNMYKLKSQEYSIKILHIKIIHNFKLCLGFWDFPISTSKSYEAQMTALDVCLIM